MKNAAKTENTTASAAAASLLALVSEETFALSTSGSWQCAETGTWHNTGSSQSGLSLAEGLRLLAEQVEESAELGEKILGFELSFNTSGGFVGLRMNEKE